ncbi:MAG: hypothetical protein V4685_08765 [Bacteroidota bacterium]
MFQKAIPLLPALNLRATVDFYETRLGFTGINMGSYAILRSGTAELHFYLVVNVAEFHPSSCLIYTDNVEDLYTVFAGKDMLYQPGQIKDVKFGRKEFSIQDNNGNVIRFSKQV